jgi:transposase
VLAYRSQYHIEDAFKQMKNSHFLGWSPMFHWTDSKIQVHELAVAAPSPAKNYAGA